MRKNPLALAEHLFQSHLKKVTGNLSFTFEEFYATLTCIKAILYSRPISPLSENPNELIPSTLGHFLRGAPFIAIPEASINPYVENISFM